mgnify:CR=1 FL=1
MCDLGTTTTQQTVPDFTAEQLAAQRTGLRTVEETMPQQQLQMLRSLGLLQPDGAGTASPAYTAIRMPIRAASGLARNAFAAALAERGIPENVAIPLMQEMENIETGTMNASRNALTERFLSGNPMQLYRPDLGPYVVRPKSVENITETNEGTGAQILKALVTAAGIYFGSR